MARRRRSSTRSSRSAAYLGLLLLGVIGAITALQAITFSPLDPAMRGITFLVLGVAAYMIVSGRSLGPDLIPWVLRRPPPAISLNEFLLMTPTEFEMTVARVLGRHGYRLRRTGGPGDLAADLVGTDPMGRPAVVQCKRYAPGHQVGSPEVQKFIGMGRIHHDVQVLVFVTTSDYTGPARTLAGQHGVTLITGGQLVALTVPTASSGV